MSGAMSRNKGANAERAFVKYLRENGFPNARRYLSGDGRQPGDIDNGPPGICLEVKNHATYDIGAWLRQAIEEAGINLPVVIMKPKGVTDPGDWWAVLRVKDAMELFDK